MSYNCSLNKIQPDQNAAIISLSFDMSEIQGDSTEITTRLDQECSSSNDPIGYPEKINVGYEYDITSQSIDEHPEPINFEEDDIVEFRHDFEIKNEGPSFTNKVQTFDLFLPIILKDHVSLKFQTIPEDQKRNATVDPNKCNKQVAQRVLHYRCEISKGLQKDARIIAGLDILFTADQKFLLKLREFGLTSPPKHDEFEFETRLEVMDEESTTKSMFKKRETKVGLSTFVKQFWPFILGSLGAIIIFASIMYVSVKNGLHQKVRFTKAKLEKQESIRKSMRN